VSARSTGRPAHFMASDGEKSHSPEVVGHKNQPIGTSYQPDSVGV
jgi:hypothetical protein